MAKYAFGLLTASKKRVTSDTGVYLFREAHHNDILEKVTYDGHRKTGNTKHKGEIKSHPLSNHSEIIILSNLSEFFQLTVF